MKPIVFVAIILGAGACSPGKKTEDQKPRQGGSGSITSAPPAVNWLFRDGFEEQTLSKWDFSWLRVKKAVSLVTRPTRLGNGALRVTLSREQAMHSKGKRSELAVPMTFTPGASYWYGISIYLPDTWQEDYKGDVLTQWFATRDKELGEKGRSPSLAIRIHKQSWHITCRYDSRALTPKNSGHKVTLLKTPYTRGVWTDWLLFVKWSHGSGGIVRVYKDGRKVAERLGPNTYNDKRGPIMKIGIYKAPWNKPEATSAVSYREALFDEVRVAPGSATLTQVLLPAR